MCDGGVSDTPPVGERGERGERGGSSGGGTAAEARYGECGMLTRRFEGIALDPRGDDMSPLVMLMCVAVATESTAVLCPAALVALVRALPTLPPLPPLPTPPPLPPLPSVS